MSTFTGVWRWELVRREYVAAALRDHFEGDSLRPWLRRWIPLEAWLRTLPTLARPPAHRIRDL
jgi:hypothetical protein